MSPEENKALGRRMVDAINAGNMVGIDELFAAAFVDRNPFPGTTPDRDGFKKGLTQFRIAFPDFRYTVEDEITVGDRLVHRLTAKGTQHGEFLGTPATGKQMTWSEIHIERIADGKLVEHWGLSNQQDVLKQMKLVPAAR